MTDFIPHYYYRIDPFALAVLALVVVGTLVGWAVWMIAEREE